MRMMSRLTWRPVESNYSEDLFIQSSHNLEMPYLRCFQKRTPLSKKCQKENDSFFYRFPFDTPFSAFFGFSADFKAEYWCYRFLIGCFPRIYDILQTWKRTPTLYQNWGANMAKDSNFDTMHPLLFRRVHCFVGVKAIVSDWKLERVQLAVFYFSIITACFASL